LIGRLYTKNEARFPRDVEYGDIVRGLPIAPESCKGVYCSHVLEHLALDGFRRALLNTYRILCPDGVFRLVVPDLEHLVQEYMNNKSSEAASAFMRGAGLGRENRPGGIMAFITTWFGNSEHLWMWDYMSLEAELRTAGFADIRRGAFGDSVDPVFLDVEERSRWENCLGIECRRPGLTGIDSTTGNRLLNSGELKS
jgi:SAM-dependent methyltransferase